MGNLTETNFNYIEVGDGTVIEDGPNSEWVTDEKRIESLAAFIDRDFVTRTNCPFCNHQLGRHYGKIDDLLDGQPFLSSFTLWSCRRCAYWQLYEDKLIDRPLSGEIPAWDFKVAASSRLRYFDPLLPDGCNQELAQYLRRKPKLWHEIDPTRAERLVRDVVAQHYPDCKVTHVGRTGDGGIDVLLVEAGGPRWLISVKRRESAPKSEPVGTLRDLLGAMVLEGARHGAIVSTGDHFTTFAKRDAARARAQGFTVELVDRKTLDLLIGKLLPMRPWMDFVEYHDPDLVKWYEDALPPLDPETCALKLA